MRTGNQRKGIVLVIILLLPFILSAQNTLNVVKTDGSTVSFELKKLRKLTFPERKVLVTSMNGQTNEFSFSEIRNLNFQFLSSVNDLKDNQLKVYPNPAFDMLVIENSLTISRILVLDIQGKLILQEYPNAQSVTIETAHYLNGIYLLQIFTSEGILTSKFVKK
jgi:hypothetical protein